MPNCRSCGAPIKFAKHVATDKAMPVDAHPRPEGNLVLFHEGDVLKVRHARLPDDQLRPRHVSHFFTCPKAASHRRREKVAA